MQRRLTPSQVRQARKLRKKGWTFRRLAEKFGMSVPSIYRAVVGRSYADVT